MRSAQSSINGRRFLKLAIMASAATKRSVGLQLGGQACKGRALVYALL
jgi:hypothetical protein